MENFLLGYFADHLSKYIIGFKREQVTANLLMGKGEITHTRVNVHEINSVLPGPLCFRSISIKHLSFNVQSFTNIKVVPIKVFVSGIHAVIEERLEYKYGGVSTSNANTPPASGLAGLHKYGLLDRVLDNITIELHDVRLSMHTLGKFKTRFVGKHTPPVLHVCISNFHYYSTDEHGDPLIEKWPKKAGRIVIYKHLSLSLKMELDKRVPNNDAIITTVLPLTPFDFNLSLTKNTSTSEILLVSVDSTVENLEISENGYNAARALVEFACGIIFCICKDQSFKDPLASFIDVPDDPLMKTASIVSVPEKKNTDVHTSSQMLEKAYADDSDEEETTDSVKVSETNNAMPADQEKKSNDSPHNEVAKSSNYFEDWFVTPNKKQETTVPTKPTNRLQPALKTTASPSPKIAIALTVNNFSCRVDLDSPGEYFQINLRDLRVLSKSPSAKVTLALVHLIYRNKDTYVPIVLGPASVDELENVVNVNADESGINIKIAALDTTLDKTVLYRLLQFGWNVYDTRWHTGNWLDELPTKLTSHEPYVQPFIPPSGEFPITGLHVAIENVRVIVSNRKIPASLIACVRGDIKYDSENEGIITMNVGLNVLTQDIFGEASLVDDFSVNFNVHTTNPPMVVGTIRNEIVVHVHVYPAYDILFAVTGAKIPSSMTNMFLKLVDIDKIIDYASSTNLIIDLDSVVLQIPENERNLVIHKIMMNKSLKDSLNFTIKSVNAMQLVEMEDLRIGLENSILISCAVDIERIMIELQYLGECFQICESFGIYFNDEMYNSLEKVAKFALKMEKLSANVAAPGEIISNVMKVDTSLVAAINLDMKANLWMNDILKLPICVSLNDGEMKMKLDELSTNLFELQGFLSTSIDKDLKSEKSLPHYKPYIAMIKGLLGNLETVDRQTDTLTRQIVALVAKNQDKLEKIEKMQIQLHQKCSQNLALIATASNNFAGYLRLNVDYSDLLLRFYVILRKGLLLIFKNCGQLEPVRIVPLTECALHGANVPRGFIISCQNSVNLICVAPTKSEFAAWARALKEGIWIANIVNGVDADAPKIIEEREFKEGDEVDDVLSTSDIEKDDDIDAPTIDIASASATSCGNGLDSSRDDNVDEEGSKELVIESQATEVASASEKNGVSPDIPSEAKLEDGIPTLESDEATQPEIGIPMSSQDEEEVNRLAQDLDYLEIRNGEYVIDTLITDGAGGGGDGELSFDDFEEENPSQIDDAPKNRPQFRKLGSKLSNPNLTQKINKFGAVSGQRFNKFGNASAKLGAAGGQRLNKLGARMKNVSQRQGTDSASIASTAADSTATSPLHSAGSSIPVNVQQIADSEAQKPNFGSKFAEAAKKAKHAAILNRPRSSSDVNYTTSTISDQQVAPAKRNDNTGAGATISDRFSRMAKSANQRIKKIGPGNTKEITPPTFAVRAKNVQIRPLASEAPPTPPELVSRIGKYTIGIRIKETFKISAAGSVEESTNQHDVTSVTSSQRVNVIADSIDNDGLDMVDQRSVMRHPHTQSEFEIVTRRTDGSEIQSEITVSRSLTQALSLHITLCSAVEKISSYRLWMLVNKRKDLDDKLYNEYVNDLKDQNLGSTWGMSPLSQVRLCGKLLDGLLKFSRTETDSAYLVYVGEMFAEFLNAAIDSPLPIISRDLLLQFLGVTGNNKTCLEDVKQLCNMGVTARRRQILPEDNNTYMSEKDYTIINDLAISCGNHLSIIERNTAISKSIATSLLRQSDAQKNADTNKSPGPGTVEIPPPSISAADIHAALVKTMAERDESHAQIVSVSVLHVRNLEQERKRAGWLAQKLQVVENRARAAEAAAASSFFSYEDNSPPGASRAKQEAEMHKIQSMMVQDNEAELLSMCRQLASEIETRTAATLEANRLKEINVRERGLLSAERDHFQSEVERLKVELEGEKVRAEKEKARAAAAEKDQRAWKTAFEELSSYKPMDNREKDVGEIPW